MAEQDIFHKATGRTYTEWIELLREHHPDLESLSHADIARAAVDHGSPEWWAQRLTATFERDIGRREVGEQGDGNIAVSASKTLPGEWTGTFGKFVEFLAAHPEHLPGELAEKPRISETEKWRYWRATFTDGTKAAINCSDASKEGADKIRMAVEHTGLPDLDMREPLKEHWRKVFNAFKDEANP